MAAIKVLVDPYVIAIPPRYSSANRISSFAQGLETWISATSYPFVKVFSPSKCIDYLVSTDRFPFWNATAELLSSGGVIHYDVQTVTRLATSIFDLWEDVDGILSSSAICGELSVMPKLFVDRLPEDVSQLFCEYLGRIAIQRDAGDPGLAEIHVGSVADSEGVDDKLTVQGNVRDVVGGEGELAFGPFPMRLNSDLAVLVRREDILRCVGWSVIWASPVWAIEKAYYSVVPVGDRPMYGLRDYDVGGEFLSTIVGLGLHSQIGRLESVYETCALVLCRRAAAIPGINPRRLKGIAKRGDGAIAMHADVSQKGAGYRLHYWRCSDGCIELACVNVHNDATIC